MRDEKRILQKKRDVSKDERIKSSKAVSLEEDYGETKTGPRTE